MSRRTVAAVAVALVALFATSCKPRPEARTADVLGDSILTQAVQNRTDVWQDTPGFPSGTDVLVESHPGVRFEDLQPGEAERANDPDHPRASILVIALGANNASPLDGHDGWTASDLQAFRTLLWTPHDSTCVVVSIPAASPAADPAVLDEFAEMRPAMDGEARRRPNTVVIDWAKTVREHPEVLSPDGVHLAYDHAPEGRWSNAEAADAFTQHLAAGVAQCPEPTPTEA